MPPRQTSPIRYDPISANFMTPIKSITDKMPIWVIGITGHDARGINRRLLLAGEVVNSDVCTAIGINGLDDAVLRVVRIGRCRGGPTAAHSAPSRRRQAIIVGIIGVAVAAQLTHRLRSCSKSYKDLL